MPFRHQNGLINLHYHFHYTCILILYKEIFQDLYVNNGTNSNNPISYFDQYKHEEYVHTTPISITWFYLPFYFFLACMVIQQNLDLRSICIQIKIFLKRILFDDGSTSCIWSLLLIVYMPCYLRPIIVGVMVWYFIFCSFSSSLFYGDDDDVNIFLLLHTFVSPKICSL